jgi:hypothetical protein
MENEYYVYIYFDPRKPGKYVYGEYEFDYEPFYVGKGFGHRDIEHLRESRLRKGNFLKNNVIKDILGCGLEPLIIRFISGVSEQDALNFEKELISKIGRLDLKLGPLTNKNNGDSKGRIISDEFKDKQSKIMIDYFKDNPISEETKEKISKTLLDKNIKRSDEHKMKISKVNKGRVYSDEHKKKISEIRKGPKLTHRNKYVIISPTNIEYNILGKVELINFINKNNLSARKFLEFVNKGKISKNDVRLVDKSDKIKTINCIGWEIKRITKK